LSPTRKSAFRSLKLSGCEDTRWLHRRYAPASDRLQSESAIDIVGIGDRLRLESVIDITGIRISRFRFFRIENYRLLSVAKQ